MVIERGLITFCFVSTLPVQISEFIFIGGVKWSVKSIRNGCDEEMYEYVFHFVSIITIFFPPSLQFYPNPMVPWAPNFYDINTFIQYNGLSPRATYKPPSNTRFSNNSNNNNSNVNGNVNRRSVWNTWIFLVTAIIFLLCKKKLPLISRSLLRVERRVEGELG